MCISLGPEACRETEVGTDWIGDPGPLEESGSESTAAYVCVPAPESNSIVMTVTASLPCQVLD